MSKLTVEEMRAECVRHYVERGHTPAHADLMGPKDEAEVRRIYWCIQEEQNRAKRCKEVPYPVAGLNTVQIVEIQANEETAAK